MVDNTDRVLRTPELLNVICNHSQNADLIRLARTFGLGFAVAAPKIWKSLESVQPLLMLFAPIVTLLENTTVINVG
jgi:hypothetical protein